MGLDIVELVMETEEAFGIAIPDDVATQLVTPALLVDYVAAHVALKPGGRCESQHVFHRLRRGFRSHAKALRWQVRRDTPLQDLVRKERWPGVWEAIRDDVGEPQWPQSIHWPAFVNTGPRTIGDLVWHVTAALPEPAGGEPWTRSQIQTRIREIVDNAVGVLDFRMTDRFVEDLGLD